MVRPGELRKAEWAEFARAETDHVWTIPGPKMRGGKEHSVPLSWQTLAIISDLRKAIGDNRRYLFSFTDRPMPEITSTGPCRPWAIAPPRR